MERAKALMMLHINYGHNKELMEQLCNEYKEIGLEEGLQQGLTVLIEAYREMDIPKEIAAEKVREKYKLIQEKTDEVMNLYG